MWVIVAFVLEYRLRNTIKHYFDLFPDIFERTHIPVLNMMFFSLYSAMCTDMHADSFSNTYSNTFPQIT